MSETAIEIPNLPTSVEAFLALRDRLATTPQGGAAVFVVAMHAYSVDPALGLPFLTIAIERDQLVDGLRGYKNKEPRRQALRDMDQRVRSKPYLARAYFQGTTPQSGYTLPAPPLVVQVREQDRDRGTGKVFVHCTGADTPRPIHMKQNNRGLWKAKNWSSLQVGCRAPVEVVDDDI